MSSHIPPRSAGENFPMADHHHSSQYPPPTFPTLDLYHHLNGHLSRALNPSCKLRRLNLGAFQPDMAGPIMSKTVSSPISSQIFGEASGALGASQAWRIPAAHKADPVMSLWFAIILNGPINLCRPGNELSRAGRDLLPCVLGAAPLYKGGKGGVDGHSSDWYLYTSHTVTLVHHKAQGGGGVPYLWYIQYTVNTGNLSVLILSFHRYN